MTDHTITAPVPSPGPQEAAWLRLATWPGAPLLCTLAAAPFLVFPGRWTPAGLALVIAAAALRWWQRGAPFPVTAGTLPVFLLLGMACVSAAVSPLPEASASKLWGLMLGVALLAGVTDVAGRPEWRWRVADGLVLAGVAVAAVGLVGTDWVSARVLAVPWLDPVYGSLPTLIRGLPGSGVPRTADVIHPRELAGALTLVAPLAAVLAWAPGAAIRRPLYLAASGFTFAVVALTQTPSAIGGCLVAVMLAWMLLKRMPVVVWLVSGGVAATAVLLVVWVAVGGSLSSSLAPDPALGSQRALFGFLSRLELWPRALAMVHDTPYTGPGLNTFPWIFDTFYSGFALGPEPHAHNFLLQTAVDLGLPGLAALIALLAGFATPCLVAARSADGLTRYVAVAALAGATAHLLFGTLDAMTLGAKPGLLLWAALGFGVAQAPRAGVRWVTMTTGGLLLVALVAPLAWQGPASNLARVAAYRLLLPAPSGDTGAFQQAAGLLRPIAEADPSNTGNGYLLASLEAQAGDAAQALADLRLTVSADTLNPLARYAAGQQLPSAAGQDWPGLSRIYSQWAARYPERALWYAAQAVVQCQGLGDRQAAGAALQAGLAAGAQPDGLLRQALAQPDSVGSCTTPR